VPRRARLRPLALNVVILSGLVKRTFENGLVKDPEGEFYAHHLLGASRDELKLEEFITKKLLLVKGEAGEEFVKACFANEIEKNLRRNQEWAEELTPSALARTIVAKEIDLFIADVGSCKAVLDEPEVRREYRPLRDPKDSLLSTMLPAVKLGKHEFAQLGVYRICFGLPRLDKDWTGLIDQAFDSLMTEGIRSLLSLYLDYIKHDIDRDSFIPFLLDEDDTVQSSVVRAHFDPLIKYAKASAHIKEGQSRQEGKTRDGDIV
jgi:hypothetical protein